MFKRKVLIAIILALLSSSVIVVSSSDPFSLQSIFEGWLFISPFLFLYGLPVSLLAEASSRKLSNQIKRALYSMSIHMGFAVIFYFGSSAFATVVCFHAFSFFIFDELLRLLQNKNWFERILAVISPLLIFVSTAVWITVIIKGFLSLY